MTDHDTTARVSLIAVVLLLPMAGYGLGALVRWHRERKERGE